MNSIFIVILRTVLRIVALITLGLPMTSLAVVASGTGFFVSSNGYIATNNHVIEGAEEISVRDNKGNILIASVVLRDQANDLAVIKVTGDAYQPLPLRSSAEIKKGSDVFAIGFPNTSIQGRESKVTTGIISSLSGIMGEPNSFQISVPIQPGNSGGPLIDMTGSVAGITTAKLSAAAMLKKGGQLPENVNYAVKSNYLLELIGTDRNVREHIAKLTSRRTLPLTALVENAEKAIVFIVVTQKRGDNDSHSSEIKSETPRYVRDAQASESYKVGKSAYERKDYQQALVNLGKASEFGHSEAQNDLGVMYEKGQGVVKDDVEAVRWYRKAAEQGNALGQNNLGVMYAKGQGVVKDETEAVRWFRKAAEQGNVYSQGGLGYRYLNGIGVSKDEAEGVRWFRKAAEQGNADSQNNLGVMYEKGQGVVKQEAEAVRWYRKAAEQ